MNAIGSNDEIIHNSQPILTRISIMGLQAERNVVVDFSTDVMILIADNGVGKTTVLNAIYAVLSGRLHRLRRIEFQKITVEFADGNLIEIPSESIKPAFDIDFSRRDPIVRRLLNQIPESLLFQLAEETRGMTYSEFRRSLSETEILEVTGVPSHYLFDLLHSPRQHEQLELREYPTIKTLQEGIAQSFPFKMLYFPTYRRIEEDLENLGYERKHKARTEGLIQFGMGDVKDRIKKITENIKTSTVDWYSKINGQMLSQFVDGMNVDQFTRDSIKDQAAMKIVLDRIGENITPERKQFIIELVESNEIEKQEYDSLVYFLSNLIKIYDQQKMFDNSIKEFTKVCNKYLIEKEVIYNESKVEINIIQKRNQKAIDFADLSSGEKQIVSLFSQLHLESRNSETGEPLETGKPLAILFDEPELSLSIDWQRMLLSDIMRSGRCKFLLATTHSPFIFENELDEYARDLSEFISYS